MIDPSFTEYLSRERQAFGALSSDFKLDLYRRHGAEIGEGCHLGPGSVILAEELVLGEGSWIGADCTIEAVRLHAGQLLRLGDRARVRCRSLTFGDNAFFAEDVEIGGGGAMDPEAELVVGSHGFVGEHVHLNPCRPLVIGDEVIVSRSAVVMTHSFAGSVLAGYPNRFAGTTIGDGVQIGIGATLFPGVEMGDGSILLSGSSLVSNVPPGRFFGGVPAADIKSAARTLSQADFEAIAAREVEEFARQLELRAFEVERTELAGEKRYIVSDEDGAHVLRLAGDRLSELTRDCVEEVRVFTSIEPAAFAEESEGSCSIDLSGPTVRGKSGPLADALREFLRKRGVRLHPRAWTYRGGWL